MRIMSLFVRWLIIPWSVLCTGYLSAEDVSIKINKKQVRFFGDCQGKVSPYKGNDIELKLDEAFLTEAPEMVLQRKICMAQFSVELPKGWQMAIKEIDFLGMADINEGGAGLLTARHRFSGRLGQAVFKEIGPTESLEDVEVKQSFAVNDVAFSSCGGNVVLKVSLTAQALKGAIAFVGGKGGIVYRSQFRQCEGG